MQGLDWDDIRYCLAVAEAGSVTAAANYLGVNHTTVSRRISSMEKNLGVALFARSTTGWVLNPIAEIILPAAERMQEEVFSIKRHVKADSQDLQGTLKVTAVDICIQTILLPALRSFSQQYPEVTIDLIAAHEQLDLAIHDADIAFRITDTPPPNVLGKRIAQMAFAVYATEAVYEQYLQAPDSVGGITWLGDGRSTPLWLHKSFPGNRVSYRANSVNVMFDLAKEGMGFAQLPCGLADPEPCLRRIPASYVDPGHGLWILSHVDLRTTARVRIFRDFMLKELQGLIPLIEGRLGDSKY